MSCYHPMVLIKTSNMTDPVQRKIAEVLRLKHKGEGRSMTTFLVPRELAFAEGLTLRSNEATLVPCGHCIGCRLDYARQWAERCIHEAEGHEYNYFLTLTYDDKHLPKNKKNLPAFFGDEISNFMKVLRQYWKRKFKFDGIRFFGCAEYGEHAGDRLINPHLHILLFNCPILIYKNAILLKLMVKLNGLNSLLLMVNSYYSLHLFGIFGKNKVLRKLVRFLLNPLLMLLDIS